MKEFWAISFPNGEMSGAKDLAAVVVMVVLQVVVLKRRKSSWVSWG